MHNYSFKIFDAVSLLDEDWDAFGEDTFLRIPYLVAQEAALPKNMNCYYVGIYLNENLVAKSVFQRLDLNGKELFFGENNFAEDLLKLLNVHLLCVGNVKITGEHAYEATENSSPKEILNQLKKAIKEVRQRSKNERKPIRLLLIKDFYEENLRLQQAEFQDYEVLSVQPNMVFEVDENWNDFNDYLSAMRTKYRTRAKRAFKKAYGLVFRQLNELEIAERNDEIYNLYKNVLENNSFSLYQLPENFFYEMKKNLNQKFHFYGGFLDEKLVCFFTIIENGKSIETGFLGYEKEIQQDKQLYLNMLYKMIAFAIDHNFKSIDFSRTAMEIKSSVGAKPKEMYGFLKHTNPILNKILRSTFQKFYTPENWVQRHPFKV